MDVQHLGWGVAATAPPAIMLVTGSIFYLSFLAFSSGASLAVAKIGVIAGNVTQVATRAAKFSLFDPAKEMVYIEMSKEEKGKGKAAVDLVGSQIGKTGASWVSQALLLGCGSIATAMPIFGCLYGAVIMYLSHQRCKDISHVYTLCVQCVAGCGQAVANRAAEDGRGT